MTGEGNDGWRLRRWGIGAAARWAARGTPDQWVDGRARVWTGIATLTLRQIE